MNILRFINYISKGRTAWALLALSAFAFELTALYFQHGMDLKPCVMCIYERVAMLCVFISACVATLNPRFFLFRWIGLAGWGYGAYKGLMLAIEHVGYQFKTVHGLGKSCDIFANFPTWAPLDQWIPWMFNPTGDCSQKVWFFMGYTMPQCLILIFGVILAIMAIVTLSQFTNVKR